MLFDEKEAFDNFYKTFATSKFLENMIVGLKCNVNIDSYEDDHSLRASDMNELRYPVKPFCQTRLKLDETIVSEEDYAEESILHGDRSQSTTPKTELPKPSVFK